MGFWEWMGFENPRDSPKTEQPKEGLPKVTDNVRDSGQTFVFGRSNAGEQVDEKAAIDYQKVQKWDGKLPTVSGGNALVSIDPAE